MEERSLSATSCSPDSACLDHFQLALQLFLLADLSQDTLLLQDVLKLVFPEPILLLLLSCPEVTQVGKLICYIEHLLAILELQLC